MNKKTSPAIRMLLLGAPLFLAACHSDLGPFPMPTGYKYHDRVYKAPRGPEPVMEKIRHMRVPQSVDQAAPAAQSAETVAEPDTSYVAAPLAPSSWDSAAQELVTRLVSSFGQPTEPVYIAAGTSASGADMMFEKALRGALAQKGFTIAPAPGMSPFTLHYAVAPIDSAPDRQMLTLGLKGPGGAAAEESGIYTLESVEPVMEEVQAEPEALPEPEKPTGIPVMLTPND